MLADSYHSQVIAQIKDSDFTHRSGRLTIHLAREFGFCYGVDRAVDYAYQTRQRFPDQRVFLTGEIIHNPHVNEKLRAMGVQFLSDAPGGAASPINHRGADADRRRDSPGVWRHGRHAAAARPPRLHPRGYDLWIGAERVEERPALYRRRLYVGHPRQGLARGNAGDRLAGRRIRGPLSRRVR